MSSSVFFKFKSSKEPQRITFDGTGITVFELKREIINISGLGNGTDFDLSIYDESSNEEYDDDTAIIPRSSSVVARRLPAARPGHGKAARYVTGRAPVNAKNSYRTEASKNNAPAKPTRVQSGAADMSKPQTEEERIAAMFAAEGNAWEQQQQQMANAKSVYHKGQHRRPPNVPDHPPPPNYKCHRCGEPGHWIQLCPTNDDPNFEAKPKMKPTTGIPRSFMKKVEKPTGPTADDGLTDVSRQGGTIMLDPDGNYVMVNPDNASWAKAEAKMKASAAQAKEAEKTGSKELQDLGLECPIDKRLFVEPMKTPCCGKTYCNDCIENALVDNDLTCPNCGTEGVLIDDLKSDDDMVANIRKYEDDKNAEKKAKEQAKSPKSEAPLSPPADEVATEQDTKVKSPSPAGSMSAESAKNSPAPSSSSTSRKRPAEEELKNDRSPPKAPAAMLRKQNQSQPQVQQIVPPGFDKKFVDMMNQYAPQMPQVPGNQQFNANQFFPQGMAPMGMPNPNMMAMPMGMPQMMGMPNGMHNGMQNPMMMQNRGGFPPMGPGMNGMGGMNNMGYPQQNGGFGGYGNGMMPNGGYGGQNFQGGTQGWAAPQHQQMQSGQFGNFPNQQPNVGLGDDGAYARKPVNPHRAQNRRRMQNQQNDYNTL
jgi:protein MPE1